MHTCCSSKSRHAHAREAKRADNELANNEKTVANTCLMHVYMYVSLKAESAKQLIHTVNTL